MERTPYQLQRQRNKPFFKIAAHFSESIFLTAVFLNKTNSEKNKFLTVIISKPFFWKLFFPTLKIPNKTNAMLRHFNIPVLSKCFSMERETYVIPLRTEDRCQIRNLLAVMTAKIIDGKFHVTGFIYYKSKTKRSTAKCNTGNVQLALWATSLYARKP